MISGELKKVPYVDLSDKSLSQEDYFALGLKNWYSLPPICRELHRMPQCNKAIMVNVRDDNLRSINNYMLAFGLSEKRRGLVVLAGRFSYLLAEERSPFIDYIYIYGMDDAFVKLAGKTYACAAFEGADHEIDDDLKNFVHSLVA